MTVYKINAPGGGEFNIDVPGGWATEDTLDAIAKKLQARTDVFSKTAKDFNKATDPSKRGSFGSSAKSAGKALDEFEEELTTTQKALSGLEVAVGSVGDIAGSLLQSTGKLTDVNPLVDSVTGRLSKFAQVAGGVEILGFSLGDAGAAATQLARDVITLTNIVGQRVIDTFDGLTTAGVGVSYNFADIEKTVAKLKISSETLIRVTRESSMALLQLGELGDIESGLNKFQSSLAIINGQGNDAQGIPGLRKQFRALGMGTNEAAMFFAEFLENNRRGLLLRTMNETQLANASLAYGKNLQVLAELTGKDIDQVRESIRTQQIATGAQLTLARLEREASDGMGGFTDAFKIIKEGVPDAFKPVVDGLFKFDTAIGEQAILGANFGKEIAQLNRDFDNIMRSNMTFEEKQTAATAAVATFNEMLGEAAGGPGSFVAEFAGLGGIGGDLETLGGAFGEAEEQVRRFGDRDTSILTMLQAQQTELMTTVKDANTVLGNYVKTVTDIEDARAEFEALLFANTQGTFDFIIKRTGDFYNLLAATLGLGSMEEEEQKTPEQIDKDKKDEERRQKDNLAFKKFLNIFLGSDYQFEVGNQLGGPLSANTLSMVGENGRELIKMGNQGGEVINNTTTEKIMGAANAVANNIGNNGNDVLKQISDTLNQSNAIQSNILKETRRGKGFQY